MTYTIIVSLISLVGTIIGTLGGIMATSRLSNYRIEQLEKKVDKHNNLIERTYEVEKKVEVMKTDINNINDKIEAIESTM